MGQKCEGDCGLWVLHEILKKTILKIWKKSWVPFGSYLLDSTADSAQFEWKWAGLAVLFSRYLPNGTHNFFQNFRICFCKDFIKNPQTTIALTFLIIIIISDRDGVYMHMQFFDVKLKTSTAWKITCWTFEFCWNHMMWLQMLHHDYPGTSHRSLGSLAQLVKTCGWSHDLYLKVAKPEKKKLS